jgi:ubiquinone/menaquinone biosynthesis C-methylase UbiE
MGSDYGNQAYWDKRYSNANEASYDWFFPYKQMKQSIYQAVFPDLSPNDTPSEQDKQAKSVLIVGCGNSELSVDMHNDGFTNVLSTDYSIVLLEHMKSKYPDLLWQYEDVRNLSLGSNEYDLIIDKGTLDSILCGTNSVENASKMLGHLYRVLKPGGVFLEYTYGTPTTRFPHLRTEALKWDVQERMIDGRWLYQITKKEE